MWHFPPDSAFNKNWPALAPILTCGTRAMYSCGNALVEDFLVVPPVGADRATLAADLVPGTVRVL